jgi:hypothetical protein
MHTLNQRRHLRQPIHSFLYLDLNGSHGVPVLDLSESGVAVVSAVPLTSKKRVTCRLDLADRPIEAEGVITSADLSGRAGIEFVSMSESDRVQLKEWLFINALTGGVSQLQEAAAEFDTATFEVPETQAGANVARADVDSAERTSSKQAEDIPLLPKIAQGLQPEPVRWARVLTPRAAQAAQRQGVLVVSGALLMLAAAGGLRVWKMRSPAPVVPLQQQIGRAGVLPSERAIALPPERADAPPSKPMDRAERPDPEPRGRIGGGSVVTPGRVAENGKLPAVTRIRHWSGPDFTRVTIDLQQEVGFLGRRLSKPDRIYFDLHDAKLAKGLVGRKLKVQDGLLLEIRMAQYLPRQARIVLDVAEISDYNAFLLRDPYRLIVDIHGKQGTPAARTGKVAQADPVVARSR